MMLKVSGNVLLKRLDSPAIFKMSHSQLLIQSFHKLKLDILHVQRVPQSLPQVLGQVILFNMVLLMDLFVGVLLPSHLINGSSIHSTQLYQQLKFRLKDVRDKAIERLHTLSSAHKMAYNGLMLKEAIFTKLTLTVIPSSEISQYHL